MQTGNMIILSGKVRASEDALLDQVMRGIDQRLIGGNLISGHMIDAVMITP
jgi:hypothetical protein